MIFVAPLEWLRLVGPHPLKKNFIRRESQSPWGYFGRSYISWFGSEIDTDIMEV